MNTIITIDKAGRVVIPKALRDKLGLAAGAELELLSEDDCVTLRPKRARPMLRKKQGVWVLSDIGASRMVEDDKKLLEQIREERDRRVMYPEG